LLELEEIMKQESLNLELTSQIQFLARNNKIDFLGFFYLVIENIQKFKKLKIFTFDLSYN
jgi:hypothetical protein